MHYHDFLYIFSGFCVGALVGMIGTGGGSVMTPLLIVAFGVKSVTAVGTDLLYAAVTKTGGTLVHGLKGTVDWGVVWRLAAGSVPTTMLTLLALSRFDLSSGPVQRFFAVSLGGVLLATALTMFFRPRFVAWYRTQGVEFSSRLTTVLTVATGVTLGVLVPVTSVGGGALGVTALVLLYPRMATPQIVGCDIAHALALTLVAGIGHWFLASVDEKILGILLVGSIPGVFIGSHLATRVPDRTLRFVLATLLALVGSKLVL